MTRALEEEIRLEEDTARRRNWKRWGPYLSERQWGTVREDYSEQALVVRCLEDLAAERRRRAGKPARSRSPQAPSRMRPLAEGPPAT